MALRESSTYYGVTEEGVISANKLVTYKSDVKGTNTPSGVYKAFAESFTWKPQIQAEAEFLRTGKGLGFEPAIQTRAELKSAIPQKPGVLDYLSYKASLPGQYVMAQGEAGLMRAVEIGTILKGTMAPSTAPDIGAKVSTKASILPESAIAEMAYGKPQPLISERWARITKPLTPDIGEKASYYAEGALVEAAYGKVGTQSLRIAAKSYLQELTAKQTPEQMLWKATGKGEEGAPTIRKGGGGEAGQAITQAAPSEKLFGGRIGRPSETMKPWDLTQTKQSATAIQMYRTEPLPGTEQMAAPSGRAAPAIAAGLFQIQVPRTKVQTEEIFGETATRQRQQQSFIQTITPAFAVAPTTRQIFATETLLVQEQQARRKITPVMMSYDVLSGQRQRTVQQQAVGLEFSTTVRRAQESQRRQDYITGIDTGVRLRQDTSILPRVSTLIDTGVAYRQRTDLITTPRITQIPRITTTMIPGGLSNIPGSGGGGGKQKRRASFVEHFQWGLDLTVGRPKKIRAKSFTSPETPRVYKVNRRKYQ